MTVFTVHPPVNNHDISDARRFGEIECVNDRFVYGDEIDEGKLPASVIGNIRRAVDRFDPDTDYLLIAGDHLQLIQFAADLSSLHLDFNVLRWERQAKAYLPVCIST